MSDPAESKPTSVNLDEFEFGETLRAHQGGDKAFGRFVMKRKLGQGGMGMVWLAKDTLLRNREVALKFAPPNIRSDDSAIEELKVETLSGQALAHPNIVRIFDFFIDEDCAAICMEYVDGETLARLRTGQPGKIFEPRHVARWIAQLLDGLSYAHRTARLVHRDLKPPNLIINKQGDLKIMDFGIARSIQDSITRVTNAGASTGTLAYMSPQQAAGQHAGPEDDIYSLGCTLYELFTGKPPFYTGDISRQLRDMVPPTVSERRLEFGITTAEPMPPVWQDVVMRCLAKQPEHRPASIDEVRLLLGLGGQTSTPNLPPVLDVPVTTAQSLTGTAHNPPTQAGVSGRAVTLRASQALQPLVLDTQSRAAQAATRAATTAATPEDSGTTIPARKTTLLRWFAGAAALVALTGIVVWFRHHGDDGKQEDQSALQAGASEVRAQPDPPDVAKNAGAARPGSSTPPESNTGTPPASQGGEKAAMAAAVPDKSLGLLVPDAYKNFADAMAAAKPGETIKIKGGTYDEPLRLVEGVSVTAAVPGEAVLISVPGAQGVALDAEKVKTPVTITGITFSHAEGDATPASAALATAGVLSSQIEFIDCVFEAGLGSGLRVEGASRVTLTRCEVRKNLSGGIIVARGARLVVTGGQVSGNGGDGLQVSGTGSAALIESTAIKRNLRNGVMVEQGASLTGQGIIASENSFNGIHAADENTTLSLKGGECARNGFSFVGKDSKGSLSGQGGAGLVAEAGARLVVEGAQIAGNARDGVNMSECAGGSRVSGCTMTSNARNSVLVVCSSRPEVEILSNRCQDSERGIAVGGAEFSPRLTGNHFENVLVGVFVDAARPQLGENTFTNVKVEVQQTPP